MADLSHSVRCAADALMTANALVTGLQLDRIAEENGLQRRPEAVDRLIAEYVESRDHFIATPGVSTGAADHMSRVFQMQESDIARAKRAALAKALDPKGEFRRD